MTINQQTQFFKLIQELGLDQKEMVSRAITKCNVATWSQITTSQMDELLALLQAEQPAQTQAETTGDFPDKWRVWDKQEQQMIYDLNTLTKASWEPSVEPDRWHWMLWTGKKDSKGKEIYDFDIIRAQKKDYIVQWDWEKSGWAAYELLTNIHEDLTAFKNSIVLGSSYVVEEEI